MRSRHLSPLIAASTFLVISCASPALAALNFYADPVTFNALGSVQLTEHFSSARSLNQNFTGPANSSTTSIGFNGLPVFLPGDLTPGVSFSTINNGGAYDIRAAAINGNTILEANAAGSSFVIDFASSYITHVSLNAYQFNSAGNITIQIFGPNDTPLAITRTSGGPSTPGFLGIASSTPISKLIVSATSILPGIDDVAFGVLSPLTFVHTPSQYASAAKNRATETFSSARRFNDNFSGPLSSTTTNPGFSGKFVFAPGDIIPGVTFSTSDDAAFDFRATTITGNSILQLNSASAKLVVDLAQDDITAVSFDAYQFNSAGNVSVDVYGPDGLYLGTDLVSASSTTPGFEGILSSGIPIKHLVINDSSILPGLDNFSFGTAIPEPSPTTLGLAPLAIPLLRRTKRRA